MGGPVFNQPIEGVDDGVKKYGVKGFSDLNSGMYGVTDTGFAGVQGVSSSTSVGVRAWSFMGYGLISSCFDPGSIGVYSRSPYYIGVRACDDPYLVAVFQKVRVESF